MKIRIEYTYCSEWEGEDPRSRECEIDSGVDLEKFIDEEFPQYNSLYRESYLNPVVTNCDSGEVLYKRIDD